MLFLRRNANKTKKRKICQASVCEHITDIDPDVTTAPTAQITSKDKENDDTPQPGLKLRRQLLGVVDAGWIKSGNIEKDLNVQHDSGFIDTLREVFERVLNKLCISRPDSSFIMDTLTGTVADSCGHAKLITHLSDTLVRLIATHFGIEFEKHIMRKLSSMIKSALDEKLLSIDQGYRRDKRLCSIHKWIDYADAFVFMFNSLTRNIKSRQKDT